MEPPYLHCSLNITRRLDNEEFTLHLCMDTAPEGYLHRFMPEGGALSEINRRGLPRIDMIGENVASSSDLLRLAFCDRECLSE